MSKNQYFREQLKIYTGSWPFFGNIPNINTVTFNLISAQILKQ